MKGLREKGEAAHALTAVGGDLPGIINEQESKPHSTVSNPGSSTINSLPLNSLSFTSARREDKALISFSAVGGWITKTIMPENSFGGNIELLRKSLSLLNNISSFCFASDANLPLLMPLAAYSVEYPDDSRKLFTSLRTFSSSRNLGTGEFDIALTTDSSGSMLQSFLNHALIQAGVTTHNLFNTLSCSYKLDNVANQHSCAFEGGLSVADFSVCNNMFADFDSHAVSGGLSVFKAIAKEKARKGTRKPSRASDSLTLAGTFSSHRSFGFGERDIPFLLYQLRGVADGSSDGSFSELWEVVPKNLFSIHASSEKLQDLPYHDSCAFECGLAVADFGVSDYVFVDFNSFGFHATNIGSIVFKPFADGGVRLLAS